MFLAWRAQLMAGCALPWVLTAPLRRHHLQLQATVFVRKGYTCAPAVGCAGRRDGPAAADTAGVARASAVIMS